MIITETPSSDVGRIPPTISVTFHARCVLERFVPVIATQEPGANPGTKLAPFKTALTAGRGGALIVRVTTMTREFPAFDETTMVP